MFFFWIFFNFNFFAFILSLFGSVFIKPSPILHSNMVVIHLARECILRVWQYNSVLQPCKCPICRRAITLLIPTEVLEAQLQDPEVERTMHDLAKYNCIFGGGLVSFVQVISPHCNLEEGYLTYTFGIHVI
jgi:hypothetical protein